MVHHSMQYVKGEDASNEVDDVPADLVAELAWFQFAHMCQTIDRSVLMLR